MKLKFTILTFLLIFAVYIFLNNHKNINTQKHLDKETIQYSLLYETLYGEFKDKSMLIFDLFIDQKEVFEIYKGIYDICKTHGQVVNNEKLLQLRKTLYEHFKNIYPKLRTNHKSPIIHFHTINNISFLRMHLLEKFGDDLTQIRPLVVQVNRTKKFAEGFEVGKSFSQYRFIYPIIDENNTHLGSVEIAYDVSIFAKEFMEHSNAKANIHVLKKVIDEKFWKDKTKEYYKESPLKGMYTLKKTVKNLEHQNKINYQKMVTSIETREEIIKMIQLNKGAFSVYDYKRGDSISVIPINNPASGDTVAYLTTKHFSKFLKNEINHFYNNLLIITFFIVIIMFLVYIYLANQQKHSKVLSEKNQELAEKKNELAKINNNLEELVIEKTRENLKQEKLILKQSKLVALGEMMDAIAHQWKQPLNVISMEINNLQVDMELEGKVSKENTNTMCNEVNQQIEHLTTTVNEFRDFFRPDKPKERYKLNELVTSTIKLAKSNFIKNLIEINVNIENENLKIYCIKTEFVHLLLNIINNSIDAFNERNIENRVINITGYEENNHTVIEICDNAGGIPEDVLPNIFKHNFTTKEEGKGSGVGLYLVNQIVEKIDGEIKAYNQDNGICFKVTIPIVDIE